MTSIEETIGYRIALLCRTHRNYGAVMLEPLGIYIGQELILAQLWREEGMNQSLLASRVGVEVSTMTKTLQRLERYGLVERRQDTEDTRVWHVFLTEQGRALQPALTTEWEKIEQQTLAGFSDDERTVLCGFLDRIKQNLA
ncbi:MAG: MarR family transcriptional regulator [Ktedonobacteraceae bacterium]|nr:MarR family transcriptional regulator [Ktedonobacteraceae bacterium]